MTTEIIDKLFLELSQVTTARTRREIDAAELLRDALSENAALKAEKLVRDAAFEAMKAKLEAGA